MAIAPAEAAARDLAAAQVDSLELARVHVDLEQRPRRHHAVDLAAVDLDRDDRALRPLVGVGAQRRPHQVLEPAQDLVVEQAGDRAHRRSQLVVGALDRRLAPALECRIEAGREVG